MIAFLRKDKTGSTLHFALVAFLLSAASSVAQAQTASKLQILLPGMVAAPGTPSGFVGSPVPQTTGVPVALIVNITDNNWNIIPTDRDQVSISASDPFANLPLPVNLVNGSATLAVTFNSGGAQALSAHDDSNPAILSATSPTVNVVSISYFTISTIGSPRWSRPGQVKVGKSISDVEIVARDANGNRVTNYNGTALLSELTDDGLGRISPETVQLSNGRWQGTIKVYRAGKKTANYGVTGDVWVRVTDSAPNPHAGESNRFCAIPESLNRLLTVLPGESFLPGSLTGRNGVPLDQQAGAQFLISVYATDTYWNQISSASHTVFLTSSDPGAVLPPYGAMIQGKADMFVQLNTAGSRTITAVDVSNSSITANTSSPVTVLTQGLDHFVINSISSPRIAGEAFPAIITAVDANGGLVSDFNGTLDLSVTTGNETLVPTAIVMSNGWWSGNITLTKAVPNKSGLVSLSVKDRTNPPHSGTSNQFNIQAGAATKLQVLLPGEYATPGIAPGKAGNSGEILSGTSLQVRINAVDAWWNVNTAVVDVVQISASDPAAGLPATAALSAGSKQFLVTLNTTGLQTITANDISSALVSAGTSGAVLVNPGNMHHFVFNTVTGPVTAGTPFPISIIAADIQGNAVDAYSGMVSLNASTGTGTVYPATINFNKGIWNGNLTLTKASNGVYLSATDAANPPHSGSSNEFVVAPGALVRLQILAPGMSATPGVAPGYAGQPESQNSGLPFPITIHGVDANWNVVTTASDSFAIAATDSLASLPEASFLVNGTRNLSITLISAGNQTISAFDLTNPEEVGIANGQTPAIVVIPSNLHHFTFSTINSPAMAGKTVTVTLRAETNTNSLARSFTGYADLVASSGAGTVDPTKIGPFVNGEWSGQVVLKRAGSDITLTASDPDPSGPAHTGVSNAFVVVPGNFSRLLVLLPGETATPGLFSGKSGIPNDQQTGAQFDVSVRATDDNWNQVGQVTDNIHLASSDSLAILPDDTRMINGLVTFTVIMGSAGTHVLSASNRSDSIQAGLSSTFSVNPGTLDHFTLAPIADQIAGSNFLVTITARDAADNPVAGFNGRARLQASTGDPDLFGTLTPKEITFVDGDWSGFVTVTRASEQVKLTCRDFAAPAHVGQSNSFAVAAGEFARLQILLPGETSNPGVAPGKSGEVKPQITGDAFVVTVNAVDRWWNPVITATGTVGLTSTDANANLPLDASLVSGSVTFSTMRLLTPGYWTITAHNRSNPAISSNTSPLVHVITGSVASFVFDPIPSPQRAGDTLHVTVRAVDSGGGTVTAYNEQASMTASTGQGTIVVGNIQFGNGIWSGPAVLTRASQSVHLNMHDFADVVRGNSNPFTLVAGVLSRLEILLAGEQATPGLAPGKSGAPAAQIAGMPFEFQVLATDAWWNQVKPDSLRLHFSTSDPRAIVPPDTMQATAVVSYSLTLLTEGQSRISVATTGAPALQDTSSKFYLDSGKVHHFKFSKIDSVQIAGRPYFVRIEAKNQYDNPVTDYHADIILSASTGNGTISQTGVTLSDGFWEGELAVSRADSGVVVYAADYVAAPNTHTGYSNSFRVDADTLAGLQILLPGETATPGVAPGKKGTPQAKIAGTVLDVLVRAVDRYWNRIRNLADTLEISASDSFAVLPTDRRVVLNDGQAMVPVTLRAAAKHRLFTRFVDPDLFATFAAGSDSIAIEPAAFSQLLLLLPGEQVLPGDTETNQFESPGRRGSASTQTSGLPFTVTALAVDPYWNPVADAAPDHIHLFATDSKAIISPADTVLVAGQASFSVTLTQGGSQILRLIDDSNPEIHPSPDGMTEVLVGGLHYEVALDTNKVMAGAPFGVQVFYKNGIGEIVANANQLVRLTAVIATDLEQEAGTLQNATFNLQAGQRRVSEIFSSTGAIRIKVEDDLGTAVAYSDPLQVVAGNVVALQLRAADSEIRGLQETTLSVTVYDAAGNPVADQKIAFEVIAGSGEVKQQESISNAAGVANTVFVGGRVTETNRIRASIDSLFVDLEVVVNLTPSAQPDGVPVNYPNPFGYESPSTRIDYYLSEDADVTLRIYDLFGNAVWQAKFKAGAAGGQGRANSNHPNSVEWSGVNDKGQQVANGGYILVAHAVANGKVVMEARRKLVVVR